MNVPTVSVSAASVKRGWLSLLSDVIFLSAPLLFLSSQGRPYHFHPWFFKNCLWLFQAFRIIPTSTLMNNESFYVTRQKSIHDVLTAQRKKKIRDNSKESYERVNFCLFGKENEKEIALRACASSQNVLKCKLQPTVWLITIHAAVNLFDQCHQYFTLQNNNN